MSFRPLLSLIGISLMLSACSQTAEVPGEAEDSNQVANVVANVIDDAQNVVGEVVNAADAVPLSLLTVPQLPGWGKDADAFTDHDIDLQPIADAARLRGQGVMGCNFAPDGSDVPIFVTKADLGTDAYALGVIGNADMRQRVMGASAGGFAAMASGLKFEGRGVALAVVLKSRVSLTPVGKDSSYPANLTVTAGSDRQRVYSGRWICGL